MHNFNPNKYKKYLSSFGCSVLDVMVRQWNEDHHKHRNSIYENNFSKHYERTLRFNTEPDQLDDTGSMYNDRGGNRTYLQSRFDNDDSPLLTSTPVIYKDKPNLVNRNKDLHDPEIPTSIQLIQQRTSCNDFERNEHHSDFFIDEKSDNEVISKTSKEPNDYVTEQLNSNFNKDSHVDWDDMFDLDALNPTCLITKHSLVENNKDDTPIFDIQFKSDIQTRKPAIEIISDEKFTVESLKKAKKRKNTTKNDVKDAKVKKTKEPKEISLKKEKYTKTVQKWLSNVTPSNSIVDNDQDSITAKQSNENINVSDENIDKKVKTTEKTKKKAVQAKLSNKDGIMKFRKPDDVLTDSSKINESTTSTKSLVNEAPTKKPAPTIKSKAKPKFIAPIKSQIPVKDVTYVITSNEEIMPDCLNGSDEIVVILTYSNGYCQLNNQHTEDDCLESGILVCQDETFYHINNTELDSNKTFIEKLLNKNIVCYEGKRLLIFLKKYSKIDIDNMDLKLKDSKIGASLIEPDKSIENFKELQSIVSYTPEFTISTECSLQKAAWYLTQLKEVFALLQIMLIQQNLWNIYIDIEMKLIPIIADMEYQGILVDLTKLKSMEVILLNKMKLVEQECYKAAGKTFQINSTLQVRNILYDELKLDTKSNIKIRETITTGAKSTCETMLRSLVAVHPLPKLILEYRHLHKAHATFLTGIAQYVKDGVVRPVWDQSAAVTGRIASNNPNLQAIPKAPFSLVMFPQEGSDPQKEELNFRSVYTAREGCMLLAADFQHIECRVFACAAADTALMEILKSGHDLFRVLASKWLKKAELEVTSEDRERTKRIVYASLYGAGTRKLMDILQISYDQTLSIVASFNRTFPSLKGFGRAVVSECTARGGRLATLCGRARRFAHIASEDAALRAQAERQAVNFVVQGTAADVCKAAMWRCGARLRGAGAGARLLLTIHDELVWELPRDQVPTAAGIIKSVMESCGAECGLDVELPVALSVGQTWGEMTEYTVQEAQ